MKERLNDDQVGMKALAPALGGNNLCTRLVFSILLQRGEKVHGSPGQSRFYLSSYFVSPSLLVTLGEGPLKYKHDTAYTHSLQEEALRP